MTFMREICSSCEGTIVIQSSTMPSWTNSATYILLPCHRRQPCRSSHTFSCRLRMIALARPSRIDILPLTTPPPKIGTDLVSAFWRPWETYSQQISHSNGQRKYLSNSFSNNNLENSYFNYKWLLHLDQGVSRADVFVELSDLLSSSLRTQSGLPAL